MTRVSKQGRKRNVSRRRPKAPAQKTGPKKDALEFGFKPHANVQTDSSINRFIPKIG